MDIIGLYQKGVPSRDQYLRNAETLSDITLPWLRVRGRKGYTTNMQMTGQASYQGLTRPYSNAGTQAISGLASSVQSLLVPPGADWFELTIPLDIQMKLPPQVLDQSKTMTAVLKQKVTDKMAEHGLYAEIGPALNRLFVEGNIILHVTDDFLRVLPMRSFVAKRCNGKVEYLVIEEQLDTDDQGDKPAMLYTYVDYDEGKVMQQKTGQKDARKVDASPTQYVLVTDTSPQLEDYATSFGWRYFGTIKAINDLSRDLQHIIKWLAVNLLLIDPNSPVTARDLTDAIDQGKDILSAMPSDFSLFNAGAHGKTVELQWIIAEIERLSTELRKAFLQGLFAGGDPTRDRVTATEILHRTQEIDGATQSLASTLMQTLQKPLVEAYMTVLNIEVKLNGVPAVRPVIIAGSSKLSRMVQVNGLVSSIQAVAQMDPSGAFIQQIDKTELFVEIAQAQGIIDARRFILQQQPQGQPGMPPQGMPPQAPGVAA